MLKLIQREFDGRLALNALVIRERIVAIGDEVKGLDRKAD